MTRWSSEQCGSACHGVAESSTFAFRVADCEGHVTVGEYDDGRPGEVFIKVSKQGSTVAGLMDAIAISLTSGCSTACRWPRTSASTRACASSRRVSPTLLRKWP